MMNAREDKALDNTIQDALGAPAHEFDFEAFKRRYPEQVRQYRSQVRQGRQGSAGPTIRLWLFAKLAVAAVILVCIGLSLSKLDRRQAPPEIAVDQPAPPMMSVFALNRAYRQGGLNAIDVHYEQAFAQLGPRTSSAAWNSTLNESL